MIGELFTAVQPPDWEREGLDWPNRAHSRFVRASAIRWHVQQLGRGPVLLALHGMGAATHSFRDLGPALAERFTVVMPDLPGHGFTESPAASRLTLRGMATAVSELLDAEGILPRIVVGHSAGAAILCRMALDQRIAPAATISINGALRPFEGVAGWTYEWAAKGLARTRVAANMVAARAREPGGRPSGGRRDGIGNRRSGGRVLPPPRVQRRPYGLGTDDDGVLGPIEPGKRAFADAGRAPAGRRRSRPRRRAGPCAPSCASTAEGTRPRHAGRRTSVA